jgi:hypothetical protein
MGKKTSSATAATDSPAGGAGPAAAAAPAPAAAQGKKKKSSKSPVERRDDVLPRSIIKDDQVHVNLAMADLMAYLQVVANNSNNLPLSRRDDPELAATVSALTAEEYARKSAAFIPADVRVIGGSFLKYGKVWDLPTSEEYIASDGAQEPGKRGEWLVGSYLCAVLQSLAGPCVMYSRNSFQSKQGDRMEERVVTAC